jgi:hypothetical protein
MVGKREAGESIRWACNPRFGGQSVVNSTKTRPFVFTKEIAVICCEARWFILQACQSQALLVRRNVEFRIFVKFSSSLTEFSDGDL